MTLEMQDIPSYIPPYIPSYRSKLTDQSFAIEDKHQKPRLADSNKS